MSAPLLFAIFHALEGTGAGVLPAPHRLALLVLADMADEQGRAWPTVERVARRAGLAPRTMIAVLAELTAAGWLEREERPRLTTIYTVRLSGGAVARFRPGRHDKGAPGAPPAPPAPPDPAPGAVNGAHLPAPGAPRPAPGAPNEGEPGAPRPAPGAPNPPNDPPRREPPKEPPNPPAGAREGIPDRPGDEVLGHLLRLADAGHPWCKKIRDELPEKGGRLDAGLREAIKKIAAEQAAKAARPARSPPRTPDVQRAEPGSPYSNPAYLTDKSRHEPPKRTGGYGGSRGT